MELLKCLPIVQIGECASTKGNLNIQGVNDKFSQTLIYFFIGRFPTEIQGVKRFKYL